MTGVQARLKNSKILIIQWATLKSEQKKNRWGYRHIEQGLLIRESISVLW